MALNIELPQLSKAIKVSKDTAFDDPKGYVCVVKEHAIVMNSSAVVVFNLRDYFENNDLITVDEEEEFDQLMVWLEGKNFTKDFWDDMSGGALITVMDDERIKIEANNYTKELIYVHKQVLVKGVLKQLNFNIKTPSEAYNTVAFPLSVQKFISDACGKIIGENPLILEFADVDKPARFIVDNKPFIFGLFRLNPVSSAKAFNFEEFQHFCEGLNIE